MQWVRNGSRLGYQECSGYGMGHAWVAEDAAGTVRFTPGLTRMQWVRNRSLLGYRGCSGYEMGHAWVTDDAVGTEWVTPGLPRMQWVRNGSRLGYRGCSGYGMGHAWVTEDAFVDFIPKQPFLYIDFSGLPPVLNRSDPYTCIGLV